MSEEVKEKEKRAPKFKYDYQQVIEGNDIDVSQLPEQLAMMIYHVDKHIESALETCTDGHCSKVIKDLQPYADFILDELLHHFDERIVGNLIEDQQEPEPTKSEPKTNEEILAELHKEGREGYTKAELRARGITVKLENRYVKVGKYVLKKLLFENLWQIKTEAEIIGTD